MRRYALIGMVVVLGLLVAAPAASAAKAGRTSVTVAAFDHDGTIVTVKQPRRFKVNSADSYVIFANLRWRGWGGARAVGHGKATTCDGTSCRSHATKLVADQLHGCFDEYWNYGRLTASVVPLYGGGPIELQVEVAPCEKPLLPGQN
jgi:hypothetical protein